MFSWFTEKVICEKVGTREFVLCFTMTRQRWQQVNVFFFGETAEVCCEIVLGAISLSKIRLDNEKKNFMIIGLFNVTVPYMHFVTSGEERCIHDHFRRRTV